MRFFGVSLFTKIQKEWNSGLPSPHTICNMNLPAHQIKLFLLILTLDAYKTEHVMRKKFQSLEVINST
jgi:hypothetical protein